MNESENNKEFSGVVNTSGGKGGDSFGEGHGGQGGSGGSVHFVKIGKEFTPEGVVFDDIKDPHKKYWAFLWRGIKKFFFRRKKLFISILFLSVLFLLTYLGYLKFTPEINYFIGKFSFPSENSQTENKNLISKSSQVLDKSIFDLAWATIGSELTSKERADLIGGIADLKTKKETGNIADIGTDGLTFVIRGNAKDGEPGLVECDFLTDWKQRLSIYAKKDVMNFSGVVSKYDLSHQWIILKNCELLDN